MVTARTLVLVLLLIAVTHSAVVEIPDYSDNLYNAVHSLNLLLNYMLEPRSVVGDMIFGVVLARGQLTVMKKHLLRTPDSDQKYAGLSTISILESKCETIYQKYMPIRKQNGDETYDNIMREIVREELWEVDYPFTMGELRKPPLGRHTKPVSPYGKPPKLSSIRLMQLLLTGHPNEEESDSCLSLLVSPVKCGINSRCWQHMTNNSEEIHGYPLTHRLLYFQVARQLDCKNDVRFVESQKTMKDLCSDILVEHKRIVDLKVPTGVGDLFLEQTSLCGLEGFAEFLNPEHIYWLLHLQSPAGCYADKAQDDWQKVHRRSSSRVKREDGKLDEYNCTMHITGMAAVYLALNIRAIVEYWNPSVHIPVI